MSVGRGPLSGVELAEGDKPEGSAFAQAGPNLEEALEESFPASVPPAANRSH
jgi:hypothetical protein